MRLVSGAATHLGLVRSLNEDSYVAGAGLYAVCDGMGGARAGEVASEEACRALLQLQPRETTADELRDAVVRLNAEIHSRSLTEFALYGMGTTLTAAIETGEPGTVLLAHVGDSRAYLLRQGELSQITEDHSLVGELVRRGQLTAAQAAVHPHRSVITRALGPEAEVEVDILQVTLDEGDRLLLATDGLSGMVEDRIIAGRLAQGDDPDQIAQSLVKEALVAGGEDNVTAVVVLALPDDAGEEPEPTEDEAGQAAHAFPARPRFGPEERGRSGSLSEGLTRLRRVGRIDKARRLLADLPGRLGRSRRALAVIAVVFVLALAVSAFFIFNSTVYFVGTQGGEVALYQGMPYTIMGNQLYSVVEVASVSYSTLDDYLKDRIDNHELVTKEEGLRFIRSLQESK